MIVFNEDGTQTINLPGGGYVCYLDKMGSDQSIVNAARVSTGGGLKGDSADKNFINYLLYMKHTSPFEQAEMQFRIKASIFTSNQQLRHRTANVNVKSARYSEMEDSFDVFGPDDWRVQGGPDDKQNSGSGVLPRASFPNYLHCEGWEDSGDYAAALYAQTCREAYLSYQRLLKAGVAKELARAVLPMSLHTEYYFKIDLHNLMHFLGLRMDPHAQKEVRDIANAMNIFFKTFFPWTHEAFVRNKLEAFNFNARQINAIKQATLFKESMYDMVIACSRAGCTDRETRDVCRVLGAPYEPAG